MTGREWSLSVLFAAFLALKAAELVFAIESWPLSNVSMFSGRRPREISPLRVRLSATRDGRRVELEGRDFRLSADEFVNRLKPGPGLARSCGALVDSYNRRRGRAAPLEAAVATVEPVARPGVPADAQQVAEPATVSCHAP